MCFPLITRHSQAALELGKGPFYRLPPALQLRLLGTMCNDTAGCGLLRHVMGERAEKSTDSLVGGGRCLSSSVGGPVVWWALEKSTEVPG